ncbi:hypothetical protein K504DRAFT_532562 [Pleomassaria siparia CBS 279.74]|uniref:ABC transporter domain-containing protein n=1 Tax=Pleomassaria siparia CBS 279.74 TaxID=1314801 RepID=A0A6G1KDT9_9PLEO|nr:hypothetical protein K504DRAFT_532562 [Pleomassaria siparia CBS 279.74]
MAQAIKTWTMMEMSIGTVSRVQQLVNDTPSEDLYRDGCSGAVVPADWPTSGAIEFHDVVAASTTPALTNVSLDISPGTKTLICGASGSGKTSLLMSLLSILLIASGQITIDGIDTYRASHHARSAQPST